MKSLLFGYIWKCLFLWVVSERQVDLEHFCWKGEIAWQQHDWCPCMSARGKLLGTRLNARSATLKTRRKLRMVYWWRAMAVHRRRQKRSSCWCGGSIWQSRGEDAVKMTCLPIIYGSLLSRERLRRRKQIGLVANWQSGLHMEIMRLSLQLIIIQVLFIRILFFQR